jgi:hypothetical protein
LFRFDASTSGIGDDDAARNRAPIAELRLRGRPKANVIFIFMTPGPRREAAENYRLQNGDIFLMRILLRIAWNVYPITARYCVLSPLSSKRRKS